MNIGTVAELSGLPAKTIRYYEDVSLVVPNRQENGYRDYSETELHKLKFLGRARALGFTLEDCRTLLALYEDDQRESAKVRQIAKSHLDRIDQKIAELQSMRATLDHLVATCAGNDKPDCPILHDLSTGTAKT